MINNLAVFISVFFFLKVVKSTIFVFLLTEFLWPDASMQICFASTVTSFVSSQNFKLQQTEVYSCKSFRWPQVSAPVVSTSLICVCVCVCVCY